jgi:hypothetical protein
MKPLPRSRSISLLLAAGLTGAALVALDPAPAAATFTPPPGCVLTTSTHVTCTWLRPSPAGSFSVSIPLGTTSVDILAIGQHGLPAATGTAVGGHGAVVTATVPAVGGETFDAFFPSDGGTGDNGGGSGGASTRVARQGTEVVVAAGGGGAGNGASGTIGARSGGDGGDPGGQGKPGVDLTGVGAVLDPPQGGGGGGLLVNGPGGRGAQSSGCTGFAGTAGSTSIGGGGGLSLGGGGGAGVHGGGGGGGAAFVTNETDYCDTGAGGGGGGSLTQNGGSIRVATDAESTAKVVLQFDLRGYAVAGTSLDFGTVKVGQTSSDLTVTLRNLGAGPMVPSTSTITGPFQRTDGCAGITLASGAECNIQVRFTPTTTGSASGVLSIPSNASNGTRVVSLIGTGGLPTASVSPATITFPNTAVGTTSSSQPVALTNTGTASMSIGTVSVAGANAADFVKSADSCQGSLLPAGASCTTQVSFRPTAGGARTATLRFTTDAAGSPHTATLNGTGLATPTISTPSSLAFGDQGLGATGAPKNLVISNTGTGPLVISGASIISGASDFAIGNSCITTIQAGSSCTATLSFRPMAKGARTGILRITSNAGNRDVALSGTGVATTTVVFRGPGSYYTPADDATATIAVADQGYTAQYYVKVTNTGATATSYTFALAESGASANALVSIKGGATLPVDGSGNWTTPVIGAGSFREFAVKVTPSSAGQTISNVMVSVRHPNGAVTSRFFTETNTDAPAKGTDGFGLFARAGSQRWIGGSLDGQTTTSNSLALNQAVTYTARIRNDGTTAHPIGFGLLGGTNACWTRVVKVGIADVTSAAVGAGYLSKTLSPGQYVDVKVTVKRVATTGCSGIVFTAQTRDNGVVQHFSRLLANPKA